MLSKHTAVGMFSGWWVSPTWLWEPEGGAGNSWDRASRTMGGEGQGGGEVGMGSSWDDGEQLG